LSCGRLSAGLLAIPTHSELLAIRLHHLF
jgi:hypothetical protein